MIFRKKKLLILLLAMVFVMTACNVPAEENAAQEEGLSDEENVAQIEEIPQEQGEPIAVVNGETLYEGSYERMTERMVTMYEQQGMPVEGEEGEEMMEQIKQQTLDQMIQQEVLEQEAENRGLVASEEAVEEELESVRSQFQTEEEFEAALAANHFSEAELTEIITMELSIEALFDETAPAIEVTEEELQAYYAQYEAQYEEQMAAYEESGEELSEEELAMMELPPYEEMKEDLREQLEQEQMQQHQQAFVSELMEESEIEILI